MLLRTPNNVVTPKEIETVHGEELILWSTQTYARNIRHKPFDLVNELLAQIDAEGQQRIFNAYKAIYSLLTEFEELLVINDLNIAIRKQVTIILNAFDFDKCRKLVEKYRDLIPEKIKDTVGDQDPDRTYTREQYLDLMVICGIMTTMAPIFGEYSRVTLPHIKKREPMQTFAYEFMMDADIFDHPAMERLRIFIESSSNDSAQSSSSQVLVGYGTDSLEEWSIATIFTRMIFINEILLPGNSMVSKLFYYIRSTLMSHSLSRRTGGGITPKEFSVNGDDESRGYLEEVFRLKRKLAEGHIVLLSDGIDYAINKMIDENDFINRKQYQESIKHVERLLSDTAGAFRITEIQTKICSLVMSMVGYQRFIENLEKPARVKVIALSQAVAFGLGHPYIAALLTAFESNKPSMIGTGSIGTRYSEKTRSQMREYCPYIRLQGNTGTEPKTPIEDTVDILMGCITAKEYRNSTPAYVGIQPPILKLPNDLRSQFGSFILKLNDPKEFA